MPAHPVLIVPYDPAWPREFDREREAIERALGPLCVAVEHGGSTAVPGLGAKPVIDIFLGVRSLDETPALVQALASLAYSYVPEYEVALPSRRYFHKPRYAAHTHHVHAYAVDELRTRHELRFRDCLRADDATARDYEALKRELARRYAHDRDGYTHAKGAFIRAVLARAGSPIE